MNPKQLRALKAALKAQGYSGDFSQKSVAEWLDANPIEVDFGDGKAVDIKAAFAAPAAKSKTIVLDPEDDDDDESDALRATVKNLTERIASVEKAAATNKTAAAITPKSFRRQMEHKAYDSAVANRSNLTSDRQPAFKCAEAAEAFGAFARLNIAQGLQTFGDYNGKADDAEIVKSFVGSTKASSTLDPTKGAAFIPEAFQAMLIDLKEEYGVARQFFSTVQMPGDKLTFPKHVNDPTVYFPGEGGSLTESDPTNVNVTLSAVKAAVMCRMSSELMNDSAIPVGDYIARTAGRALAKKEDEMALIGNGDGPTYGGAVGASEALELLSGTVANIAGLQVGSGNAWSELTDNDVWGMISRLPNQFHGSARMVCSRQFFWQVLYPFLAAGGGVTMGELANRPSFQFAGYPIMFSQVMPIAEANSSVCLLLGDGARAGYIGDVRNGQAMSMSEHRYFDTDQIAFKVTNRVAVNIYGVGNASATAADREAGSIVGLITAAS